MTVSSEQSSVTYTGNGVTTLFAIPYYFLEKTHILVTLTDSAGVVIPKVLNIDYTVAGAGNEAGGSLTFLVAPPNLSNLIIARNVPATQLTEYRPNDDFPAESHERALDKLTMISQQVSLGLGSVNTQLGKTVRTPEAIPALPDSVSRAGKLLTFDASGNPVVAAPASGSVTELAMDLANATDPNKGAGLIGFLPAGTGSVGRTALSKLREWVSVEDHGALGDGVTDDTAKIQSVINATPAGVPVIFDPSKTYSVNTLILKPGGVYASRSFVSAGYDHTVSLPRIKYRGATGNVFQLGTPGGSPVRGAVLCGLAIDGNATTGAVVSWSAHRGKILHCTLHNAKDLILFEGTTSWAGENIVEDNQLFNFTDAIRSVGIYAIDGFLIDNKIFSGVRGIVLAEMAGWNITLNHTYGISGAHMDLTGSLCMVHHNYCDNIQSIGILLTISTAVSGTQLANNNITGVTSSNVIAISVIANATGKALISANTIYFVTALTGTTGIKTSGPSTFFGSVIDNQVEQADTPYDLHSAPTTDFTEARSSRFLINGTELRMGHNGNSTWQNSLMSVTLAPNGIFAANAGSLAMRTSGGAGGSGELYLKASGSGNTGWTQVVTAVKGSAAGVDMPSVPSMGTHTFDVTVTGATLGNTALAAGGNASGAGLLWSAQVSAADTVKVTVFNPTGVAIDPTSQTVNVTVFK